MVKVKPQPKSSISVLAVDRKTNESKSITVYDTTPEEVIALLVKAIEQQQGTKVKSK